MARPLNEPKQKNSRLDKEAREAILKIKAAYCIEQDSAAVRLALKQTAKRVKK